jgi:hypothetical protein
VVSCHCCCPWSWCRRAYEEWVFARTKAINKARSKASVSAAQEPKRSKTAWDALLEEMEWLAKDFMRSALDMGALPTVLTCRAGQGRNAQQVQLCAQPPSYPVS